MYVNPHHQKKKKKKKPQAMLSYIQETSRLAPAPQRWSDSPAVTSLGQKAFNAQRCVILMSAPLTPRWMLASDVG